MNNNETSEAVRDRRERRQYQRPPWGTMSFRKPSMQTSPHRDRIYGRSPFSSIQPSHPPECERARCNP
ncbi:hypothetical protein JJD41_03875 [Oxynema sp. CENA135]|uniref:hypothetical protein n=1 Tax=Oxynema sp. CENA135 TaxID=984206 RepID=UPI00190BE874|nr:hypothetical protein [Oxynema sp. CENA135]MBK4729029.1 hypothetical protein [Oxynema sp. CENA135]